MPAAPKQILVIEDEPHIVLGLTDALEFEDGKLMLNRAANVQGLDWEMLKRTIGLDRIRAIVAESSLVGMVNWTVMGGVNSIWRGLRDEVLGENSKVQRSGAAPSNRSIFIDLLFASSGIEAERAALREQLEGAW